MIFAVGPDSWAAIIVMVGSAWLAVLTAVDRYGDFATRRREREIRSAVDMAVTDCKDRLAEKDRRIDQLEDRIGKLADRITQLERENERLTITYETPKSSIPSKESR